MSSDETNATTEQLLATIAHLQEQIATLTTERDARHHHAMKCQQQEPFGCNVDRDSAVEEALRQNQLLTQSIIDNIPAAILVKALDGTILFTNQQLHTMLQLDNTPMIGKQQATLLDPNLVAVWQHANKRVQTTGKLVITEITIPCNDTTLIYETTKFPIMDEQGTMYAIGAISTDVTERRMMETEVRENEERYRLLVEHSPELIVLHAEGIILYINQAGAVMLGGSSPNEFIGRNVQDFIAPHCRDMIAQRVQQLSSGTTSCVSLLEEQFVRLDGSLIDVEVIGTGLLYNGKPTVQVIARDITERKRAKHALNESETRYRVLVESATDAIFQLDTNGHFLFMNAEGLQRLHCTHADVIGHHINEIFPSHLADIMHNMLQTVFTNKQKLHVDYPIVHNGNTMYYSTMLVPVFNEQHEIQSVIGIAHDTTEHRTLEQELRASKAHLQAIFDTATVGIVTADATAAYTYVNKQAADMFGYTVDEMYQCMNLDLTHPNDKERSRHYFEQALCGNYDSYRMEKRFVHKDGSIIWADVSANIIRNEYQELETIVGVIVDITQRRAMEERLRFQAHVLDTVGQAIIAMQLDGTITYWNCAAEVMYGWLSTEVCGSNILDIIIHDQTLHDAMQRSLEQVREGATWSGEIVTYHRSGTPFPVYITDAPYYDEQHNLIGVVRVAYDITEQKQAEEAIRQAYEIAEEATRARSLFLAHMSHEIRTPLNAIVGMVMLLLDTPLSQEQQDFAQTIRLSSEILLTLINDVLDFSKIEAGKLEIEQHPFNIRHCIEDAIELIAPKAAEKYLAVAYTIDDGIIEDRHGDSTRVRQILVNLLSNAVKFTKNGEVIVGVSLEQHEQPGEPLLHISVRDTGIGIPPERMNRLFHSFSQVDVSTTRHYGGTGLGLAISSRLAQAMGGSIWVESVEGVGSTFHVTFAAPPTDNPPCDFLNAHQPVLHSKRVMLISNSTIYETIMNQQLTRWGMLVDVVAFNHEQIVLCTPCDVILLMVCTYHDLQMAMPTIELLQHHTTPSTPLMLFVPTGIRPTTLFPTLETYLVCPFRMHMFYTMLVSMLQGFGYVKIPTTQQPINYMMAHHYPLNILLAEDNVVNQKVAVHLLKKLGYHVDIAANGYEVLDAMKHTCYDVIFMDVEMPDMNGIETTKHIRAYCHPEQQPYIIAMTAHSLDGDRDTCLQAGMDNYLSKPVRFEELTHVLEIRAQQLHLDATVSSVSLHKQHATYVRSTSNISNTMVAQPPEQNVIVPAIYNDFLALVGGGNTVLINELLTIFLDDTTQKLQQLHQAVQHNQRETVMRIAHTLKSSSRQLGAVHLADLYHIIEQQAKLASSSSVTMACTVDQISKEYQRVQQVLQQTIT